MGIFEMEACMKHTTNTHSIGGIVRLVAFAVLMMLAMLAFLASISKAMAVTLKAESVVTADNITVGDVFDGLTHNADYVLAPAPQPGTELVWDAFTLNRIAKAFNLPWAPDSTMTNLKITRLATVIDPAMIKGELKSALGNEGVGGLYEINLTGEAAKGFVLPYELPASVAVENLSYDPARRSFTAIIKAPAEGAVFKTSAVHGVIVDMETVPVVKNRIRRGDIISASDVEYLSVRRDAIADDTILNEADLVGFTPRTSINPGQPVRSFDLQAPKIVKRGTGVTMVYSNGRIRLETQGKALQDGSKGDVIRVLNVSSNKTIEARITGEQTVTVSQ